MAKRTIVWTKTADIQFVGILEYWLKKNRSSSYSKKLIHLVSKLTEQIADNPFLYKPTNFKNTRVAPLGNFSIYYKFTTKKLIILAFWDNRQEPLKLLELLKNTK